MTTGLATALADAAEAGLPDTVALMRILIEAPSEDGAHAALARAIADHDGADNRNAADRLRRVETLWGTQPAAWTIVRSIIDAIDHDRRGGTPDDTLRYWASAFDRLASTSPEASVALYSLGSPDLLAEATSEVVRWIEERDLLGQNRDALDLGCGIGRFLVALSPHVRHITGLDLSKAMVAEAARRCRHLANVRVGQTTGHDLGQIATDSVDFVLAADVFPYLVQAGGGLPDRHFAEHARILRAGGAALIVNYSYRGDLEADRTDVATLAARSGLAIERNGTAEFRSWDGRVFLLRKRGR